MIAGEARVSSLTMRERFDSGASNRPAVIAVGTVRSFGAKGHNVSDRAASFIPHAGRPANSVGRGRVGVAVRGKFSRVLLMIAGEARVSSLTMRERFDSGASNRPAVIAVGTVRSFGAKGHNVSDRAASFIPHAGRPADSVGRGWVGVAVKGRFSRVLLRIASEGKASSPIMRWRLVSAVD